MQTNYLYSGVINTLKDNIGENGMKANRKFVEGDEAVSAVIGVILMVAITVAIAATVYVYVSGMIGVQQTVPTVQMLASEDTDRLSVINTDAGLNWTTIAIRSTASVAVYVNGEVLVHPGLGVNLTANEYHKFVIGDIVGSDGSIHGSDFIDIESNTGSDLADVTITIVHDDTDTTLGTYKFSSVSARAS